MTSFTKHEDMELEELLSHDVSNMQREKRIAKSKKVKLCFPCLFNFDGCFD